MPFVPNKTKQKEEKGYKTIYLSDKLKAEVENVAKKHNTSFNNVIVSMIEYCLKEQ